MLVGLWLGLHLALRSPGETAIVAHRGAAGAAPENTLAGVRLGLESGAEFVEVDLRQTQDGVFVLLHDRDLGRTTPGDGAIDGMTWDEIKGLDAGAWFSPEFTGEGLARLEDLEGLVRHSSSRLVLEMKDPHLAVEPTAALAQALENFEMDKVEVVSFDHGWLREFGRLRPEIGLGELSLYPLRLPRANHANRVGVHWLAPLIDPSLLRRAHEREIEVWVWTVDLPVLMRLLAWHGVDGITTNRPGRALHVLRGTPR